MNSGAIQGNYTLLSLEGYLFFLKQSVHDVDVVVLVALHVHIRSEWSATRWIRVLIYGFAH